MGVIIKNPTIYKGLDGKTPYIGDNGNWFIGETDTAIKAKAEDGVGVANLEIVNENLVITYTDNNIINLGKVVGEAGIDGVDGIGIKTARIDEGGNLVLTYTNDTIVDLGKVRGTDGINGKDAVGIAETSLTEAGELKFKYTDNTEQVLGKIVGTDGKGIAKLGLNQLNELIITYTDNKEINLGRIVGTDGKDGVDGKDAVGLLKAEIKNRNLMLTLTDNSILEAGRVVPEKGVDYWTALEVKEMKEEAVNDVLNKVNSVDYHICAGGEYDSEKKPIIAEPQEKVFYLVPSDEQEPNLFVEWLYINGNWEIFGSASIDVDSFVQKEIYNTTIEAIYISINEKQSELVSGENIKTINGNSILGNGDLSIDNVIDLGTFENGTTTLTLSDDIYNSLAVGKIIKATITTDNATPMELSGIVQEKYYNGEEQYFVEISRTLSTNKHNIFQAVISTDKVVTFYGYAPEYVLTDDVDSKLSETSVNPIQNKIITAEINSLKSTLGDINRLLDTINGEVI